MSRQKITTIIIAVGVLILLIALFRSCRGGHRPPSEQGTLEGTSYRADNRAAPTTQESDLRGMRTYSGAETGVTAAVRLGRAPVLL